MSNSAHRHLGVVGHSTLALLLVGFATGVACHAQAPDFPCPSPDWLPGQGVPGVALDEALGSPSQISAMTMWDPDAAGPMTPVVVIAGEFWAAGTAIAEDIATYDPSNGNWQSLHYGIGSISHVFNAVVAMPDGSLIAGGNGLERYDAGVWSSVGSLSIVKALTVRPNGELIVGGQFSKNIARWDGTNWLPIDATNAEVRALATLPNGDVVAGGNFVSAGSVSALFIARWDGTTWSPIGAGVGGANSNGVNALTVLPNGDLIAGGYFSEAGGLPALGIARWDGSLWKTLGAGLGVAASVDALCALPNADLIAGGTFPLGPVGNIARWNGLQWTSLGSGTSGPVSGTVKALVPLTNNDVIAGGVFAEAGGLGVGRLARWKHSESTWSTMADSFNAPVTKIRVLSNGDVAAVGGFSSVGGVSAKRIAIRKGGVWSPMGLGIVNFNDGSASDIAELPGGVIAVAGDFTKIGGINANRIASWNGSLWSPLSSGTNEVIYALTTTPAGELYAGGAFTTAGGVSSPYIARWNGLTWSKPGLGVNSWVSVLATRPNGDVVAAGKFTTAGGISAKNIAIWNGSNWSALGTGVSGFGIVKSLATMPNGDVLLGGSFFDGVGGVPNTNGIARWDGAKWNSLGTGTGIYVYAITALPDGGVIAGGHFIDAGGTPVNGIARWDESKWLAMGAGIGGSISNWVGDLAVTPSGNVLVAGSFLTAGENVSAFFAEFGCPATPCYPDCDASNSLDIDDFICFQTLYALSDPKADCDASGSLDIDDFICFQTAYALGC